MNTTGSITQDSSALKIKAARHFWLNLADVAVTFALAALVGKVWGIVPATIAVLVGTTIFHHAGKRLGLA